MPHAHQPTLGRVGQILAAFYKDGLLDRVDGKAQGSQKAGFFALTEQGRELCRRLGFEREELFPATDAMLRRCLTREHLARTLDPPGQIVSVFGYRGGLGRTTLVAHVAKGLAERLGLAEKLLVADLDLGAPGLDDFFDPKASRRCRGLAGLLVDYERRPEIKRPLWLKAALSSRDYVLRPKEPAIPGLVYLPSGLSADSSVLSASERAEALALLRAEAGLTTPHGGSVPGTQTAGFLGELKKVLHDDFAHVVVDSQFGHSLGAWVATQALADDLVICAQEDDTSPATLSGLRSVLACYINERLIETSSGGLSFLFRVKEGTTQPELARWINKHLRIDGVELSNASHYRVEQLPYDVRLAKHRHHWENTHFYRHVIALFDPNSAEVFDDAPPPELQILLDVLNPVKDRAERALAAGLLENAPLRELSKWIDFHNRKDLRLGKSNLPAETDEIGEELVRGMIETQSRLLVSKILKTSKYLRVIWEKEF